MNFVQDRFPINLQYSTNADPWTFSSTPWIAIKTKVMTFYDETSLGTKQRSTTTSQRTNATIWNRNICNHQSQESSKCNHQWHSNTHGSFGIHKGLYWNSIKKASQYKQWLLLWDVLWQDVARNLTQTQRITTVRFFISAWQCLSTGTAIQTVEASSHHTLICLSTIGIAWPSPFELSLLLFTQRCNRPLVFQ